MMHDLPFVAVATATVILVMTVVAFLARRIWLIRMTGSFDCSVRLRPGSHGWSVGVARYSLDRLDWFAVFSLLPRPSRSWERRHLRVVATQRPGLRDQLATMPSVVVVECEFRGEPVHFAMVPDASTGFSSWLESAPPGPVAEVQ